MRITVLGSGGWGTALGLLNGTENKFSLHKKKG